MNIDLVKLRPGGNMQFLTSDAFMSLSPTRVGCVVEIYRVEVYS
ncbi:hypothetical protein GCM10008018_60230 [Paenibacillus marchantiophytorum]|uniref:Uncharacterized protein n=1 Tax=Paenibacillus marchantiophytorum TaxID=1619310 RepID=A0ABQ1FCD7_9BACL|nr:hypothetical protein GCM10008018_60230 [Paenibacillus marchantiophytorum]